MLVTFLESQFISLSYLGTTAEYIKAIAHHSQQSSADTLYPGDIYDTLKRFFEQKSRTLSTTDNHVSTDFAWLISPGQVDKQIPSDKQSLSGSRSGSDYNGQRGQSEGFNDPNLCIESLKSNIELSQPQVLFLRGHPSPEWVASIGAFCYVDPELFRQFLKYRAGPEENCYFHSAPPMMSHIFSCKYFTIGSKNKRYRSSQQEIDNLRATAANDMHKYRADLRGNWALKWGDSIVRDFHVLDERHCVIEQEIVVSILDVGKTWMGKYDPMHICTMKIR